MKKLDNNRHSLVAFLESIKFSKDRSRHEKCETHFARPLPHTPGLGRGEEAQLIRSAN